MLTRWLVRALRFRLWLYAVVLIYAVGVFAGELTSDSVLGAVERVLLLVVVLVWFLGLCGRDG